MPKSIDQVEENPENPWVIIGDIIGTFSNLINNGERYREKKAEFDMKYPTFMKYHTFIQFLSLYKNMDAAQLAKHLEENKQTDPIVAEYIPRIITTMKLQQRFGDTHRNIWENFAERRIQQKPGHTNERVTDIISRSA